MDGTVEFTDADVYRHLRLSGLPQEFRNKTSTLTATGGSCGRELADRLRESETDQAFRRAKCVNFSGDGRTVYTTLFLYYRQRLLEFQSGSVYGLASLLRLLEGNNREEQSEIFKRDYLVMMDFHETEGERDFPFGSAKRRLLQDFLMEYLNEGGRLIVGGDCTVEHWRWYHQSFVQFLSAGLQEVDCYAGN